MNPKRSRAAWHRGRARAVALALLTAGGMGAGVSPAIASARSLCAGPKVAKAVWVRDAHFHGWSLHFYPTRCGRSTAAADPRLVFDDAIGQANPPSGKPQGWDPDSGSLFEQFECHAKVAQFIDPTKPSWDLETFRPQVPWVVMILDGCNPPPASGT